MNDQNDDATEPEQADEQQHGPDAPLTTPSIVAPAVR